MTWHSCTSNDNDQAATVARPAFPRALQLRTAARWCRPRHAKVARPGTPGFIRLTTLKNVLERPKGGVIAWPIGLPQVCH